MGRLLPVCDGPDAKITGRLKNSSQHVIWIIHVDNTEQTISKGIYLWLSFIGCAVGLLKCIDKQTYSFLDAGQHLKMYYSFSNSSSTSGFIRTFTIPIG